MASRHIIPCRAHRFDNDKDNDIISCVNLFKPSSRQAQPAAASVTGISIEQFSPALPAQLKWGAKSELLRVLLGGTSSVSKHGA